MLPGQAGNLLEDTGFAGGCHLALNQAVSRLLGRPAIMGALPSLSAALGEDVRAFEGIRQGIGDMNADRTTSLDEFKEHARTKRGIRK